MRYLALLLGIGLLASVGCNGRQTGPAPADDRDNEVRYEEYRKDLDAKLEEMDREIDEWQKKATAETGEAREALEAKLANLKDERAEVRKKLDELGDATAETWEDTKRGVDRAFNDLQDAYREARKEFKD